MTVDDVDQVRIDGNLKNGCTYRSNQQIKKKPHTYGWIPHDCVIIVNQFLSNDTSRHEYCIKHFFNYQLWIKLSTLYPYDQFNYQ